MQERTCRPFERLSQRIIVIWIDATKRKDVNAVLALYTDDAIVLPPGAAPVTGRDAIREFYKRCYADPS
jgi:uncharacterized protein (TIGR02246 family)